MSLSFLKIDFPRTAEDSILDFSDYNFLNLVVWFLSAIYHVGSVISSTHKVCNRPPLFYNSTKQLRWYPIWYFTIDVNRKIKANTFQISPTITQYQELAVGLKQIKERGIFRMNKNKSV